MFVLRLIANGIWPILFLGALFAIFNTFLARIDRAVQDTSSYIFSADLHYTGLGIVILLVIAFILGLIKEIKISNGMSLSFGTLVGIIVKGKLKRVLSSPIVEIETIPGVKYERGWLVDVVREKIIKIDGT